MVRSIAEDVGHGNLATAWGLACDRADWDIARRFEYAWNWTYLTGWYGELTEREALDLTYLARIYVNNHGRGKVARET